MALGVGAVVERSVAVFTVIKLAGAVYLVFLGVQAIRHRRSLGTALGSAAGQKSIGAILRDGFVVGVSNPKAIVFFAAVLPQFVNPSAGHVPLQMLLLGTVFAAIAVLCDSTWALAASRRVSSRALANCFGLPSRGTEPVASTGLPLSVVRYLPMPS